MDVWGNNIAAKNNCREKMRDTTDSVERTGV
jgi:hypothetical protein